MEKMRCPFCGKKELVEIDKVKNKGMLKELLNKNKDYFVDVEKITSEHFLRSQRIRSLMIYGPRVCESCWTPVLLIAGISLPSK